MHWVWFHYATDFLRIPALVIGGVSLHYQHNLLDDIESDAREAFELARNQQDDYEYMANLKDTLSSMLSSLFDASCTVNRHSGILSWTPQLQALLGMDELPAPSQSVYDLVSEGDAERLQSCLQLAMSELSRTAVTIQVTLSCRTLPGSEREKKDVKLFCIKLPRHARDSGQMNETQIFIGFQELDTLGLRATIERESCGREAREISSALHVQNELDLGTNNSNNVTARWPQDLWDALMKEEDEDGSLDLSVTVISAVSSCRRSRSKTLTNAVPRATVFDASTQATIGTGLGCPPIPPGPLSLRRRCVHLEKSSGRRRRTVTLNTSFRVLEQFAETPRAVVKQILVETLLQINPCGIGCCTFHVCAASLERTIRELCSEECRSTFELQADWQCSRCRSLNQSYEGDGDDDQKTCQVCNAENYPAYQSTPVSPSHSDAPHTPR
eukprot:TRINITY_DN21126_c0_g1_i1.p1 TRINITY_DN21126_c0_g1~~TRINITY_DN21126_c0_g1_i1.p1  ORF type:complete len:512 (+),score=45.26 TRINITY_DN21126_c0_g1_i1:213-1538(+)